MVDVLANSAAGDNGNAEATLTTERGPGGQATAMTRRERARFEHEVAVLDLTEAAQAMARSQVELAEELYAGADRHRRMAARLESEFANPDVNDLEQRRGPSPPRQR